MYAMTFSFVRIQQLIKLVNSALDYSRHLTIRRTMFLPQLPPFLQQFSLILFLHSPQQRRFPPRQHLDIALPEHCHHTVSTLSLPNAPLSLE